MDSIFHEKQEGQLCAQHCINSLLQGPYFNAVDLSEVASELDEVEKMTMAEGHVDIEQLERIMQQPSSNMDDSGYFSVQVISKALSVWSLSMVPLSSPSMREAMEQPTAHNAFICHHKQHWFTVRKLGKQWFNLDSLKKQPELISDTYLKLFLAQLRIEEYSIFVVEGSLPSCEADHLLSLIPIQPPPPSTSSGSATTLSAGGRRKKKLHALSNDEEEEEVESEEEFMFKLASAMSASLAPREPQATQGSLLGLPNQDPSFGGCAGIPLSRTHSGSFDSVNTTTSFGIERHPIHRSNSVDSLVTKKCLRLPPKLKFSIHRRKDNGKNYDSLVESASVMTTFSACERTKEFSRSYPEDTTCKSSTKYGEGSSECADREAHPNLERRTGGLALQKDEVSSGHFLVEVEPETMTGFASGVHEGRSQLGDDGDVEDESSSVLPVQHLHPSIVQKLSHEEWHELISYTCTTLGQSLLASILDHPSLLERLVRMDHISPPLDESFPRTTKERTALPSHEATEDCTCNIENMLGKLKLTHPAQVGDKKTRKKLERTTSLPPLHHLRIGVSEPDGNGTFLDEHNDFHCQSKHNREVYGKHIYDRSELCRGLRDGSELQRSPVEGEGKKCKRDREKSNGRNHMNCSHSRHHSSHGRKMRGRSRSDSVRDPRSHVDTSLDDDCPGVPENRIRRPRHHHHHHHHQHFIWKQCVEEFGPTPCNRGKPTKKGWCQKHSPDHENVNSSGSGSEHTLVGPVVSATPEDLQTATLLLERSTELGDESGNEELVWRAPENRPEIDSHTSQHHSGDAGGLHDAKPHPKKKSIVLCNPDGELATPEEVSERHKVADWSEFPIPTSKSGRDSPATDMAVACLDMNSPRMLQPLGGRSQGLPEEGEVRHMYFYNHQHYHHFIHHSQP